MQMAVAEVILGIGNDSDRPRGTKESLSRGGGLATTVGDPTLRGLSPDDDRAAAETGADDNDLNDGSDVVKCEAFLAKDPFGVGFDETETFGAVDAAVGAAPDVEGATVRLKTSDDFPTSDFIESDDDFLAAG